MTTENTDKKRSICQRILCEEFVSSVSSVKSVVNAIFQQRDKMTGAYEFVCKESSTEQLCARLNALRRWQWNMGDSYWYGDYVRCKPFPGVRIRIIDFPKQVDHEYKYEADVRLSAECVTPMETIDELFRKALMQIGAHNIREIEPFD